MRSRSSFLAIVLLLSGCASVKHHLLDGWAPQQRTPEQIAKEERDQRAQMAKEKQNEKIARSTMVSFVHFTPEYVPVEPNDVKLMVARPTEKYFEMGTMRLEGSDGETFDDLTEILRIRAAMAGVDAIVDFKANNNPVGVSESGGWSITTNGADPPSSYKYKFKKEVSGVAIKFEELP